MSRPICPVFFHTLRECASGEASEDYKTDKVRIVNISMTESNTLPEASLLLPHPNMMKSLAQEYFRYFNPYVPILEPSVFYSYLDEHNPSLPKEALIMIVCLSGACYYPHKATIKGITLALLTRFHHLTGKIYRIPCIQTVQAFLIASQGQISERTNLIKNGWYYYSIGCNMARMLGFYRRCPHLRSIVQEERTRTWMTLYGTSISYYAGWGKPYSISLFNTDIPLWTLDTKHESSDVEFYNQNKFIVTGHRLSIMFVGLREMLLKVKNEPKLTDKRAYHSKLNLIEKYIFSWYGSLPPYLYSKAKKSGFISFSSCRNPFSCLLHVCFFYHLLELNRLKLEPHDWTNVSFSRILNFNNQIDDVISVSHFSKPFPPRKMPRCCSLWS
ncbi:Transcriptional activator of fatty acid utilization [Entomophthora muscae]|uniref:Transcriptional activator of fatty acid utilization n=1 Tax=Entomophthora muscae TaxID=34485 RepID=A0ACC2RY50_9FUNG|nr:Transcriptional activator of fatty acid utilization [Entomophthora muscae]